MGYFYIIVSLVNVLYFIVYNNIYLLLLYITNLWFIVYIMYKINRIKSYENIN